MSSFWIGRYRASPFGVRAVSDTGGGTGWNDDYSFLVVAWDTDDESDFRSARVYNYDWANVTYLTAANGAEHVAISTGDKPIVSWAHPHPPPESHYSVYYCTGETVGNTMTKVLPASGLVRGNIPPSTTSLALPNTTSQYETRIARIISKNFGSAWFPIVGSETAVNNEFYIADDHTDIFTNGLTLAVNGSTHNDGTYTIIASSFGGGQTLIQVTENVPTADEVEGSLALTSRTLTVPGDISVSLANGTTIVLLESGTNDSGTRYVLGSGATNVTVDFTDDGKVTKVVTAGYQTNPTLGFLQYNCGPLNLQYAALNTVTLTADDIADFTPQLLDKHGVSITGNAYTRSYVGPLGSGKQSKTIEVGIYHGSLTMDDLYWLNEWQDKHERCIIVNNVDTDKATYPGWYIGYITNINDIHTYLHYNEDIRITFEVEYEVNAQATQGVSFLISTATAGAAETGSITLSGYHLTEFCPGRCVRITSSTGNDGYYSVHESSYTAGVTTITFDQAVPNGTDDGYVRTYDF